MCVFTIGESGGTGKWIAVLAYLLLILLEGGWDMSKKELVVRCVFTPGQKELQELLEESFRAYLRCILAERSDGMIKSGR